MFPLDPPLFYSYETCGILSGKNIRVSYPDDSGSGFTIVTVPTDSGQSVNMGSIPEFVNRIFAEYGITLTVVPISPASKAKFPMSSYTTHTHEVALNGTYLCIGNFWETPVRTLMSSFTLAVYEDLFYLAHC